MSHARQHLPPGSTLAVLPEGAMLTICCEYPPDYVFRSDAAES